MHHIVSKLSYSDLGRIKKINKRCYQLWLKYSELNAANAQKIVLSHGLFTFSSKLKCNSIPLGCSISRELCCFVKECKVVLDQSTLISIGIYDLKKNKALKHVILSPDENILKMFEHKKNFFLFSENKKSFASTIKIYHFDEGSCKHKSSPTSIPISSSKNNDIQFYNDKFYTIAGRDVIKLFDCATAALVDTIDFKAADSNNRIVGIKIAGNVLFVRFVDGVINLIDAETRGIIKSLNAPECLNSQEHFEVVGNNIYTANEFVVTKWSIPETGDSLEEVCKISYFGEESLNSIPSSRDFSFCYDKGILYLNVPNHPIQAWDCDTLECLKVFYSDENHNNHQKSQWQPKKIYANDGVLLIFLEKNINDNCYEILDLTLPHIDSLDIFKSETKMEKPKSKMNKFSFKKYLRK